MRRGKPTLPAEIAAAFFFALFLLIMLGPISLIADAVTLREVMP